MAVVAVVVIFVVVSVVLTLEGRARPVSVDQAVSHYHPDASADRGVHPTPGVYDYRGSGTDRLTLPPLKQAEGPTLPGTVEVQANGCWSFRIDYSTNHWQSWTYCAASFWARRDRGIGLPALDHWSAARDQPLDTAVSIRIDERAGDCVHDQGVAGTMYRVLDADPRRIDQCRGDPLRGSASPLIARHKIASVHVEVEWRLSGPQVGIEHDDLWYDARSGLPLENRRSIHVRTTTPFGSSTYTENGQFVLESLHPRT